MQKLTEKLNKSPINYFSDLFVIVMVVAWIVAIIIMIGFAAYSTIVLYDNSIWCEISSLVSIPLSCGGAIWMVKNSVQHAIAYSKGERACMDFPAVNADGECDGAEQPMYQMVTDEDGFNLAKEMLEDSNEIFG